MPTPTSSVHQVDNLTEANTGQGVTIYNRRTGVAPTLAGNGSTDDGPALATLAGSAAYASGDVLELGPATYYIGTNQTISCHFRPLRGAVLKIASGVTLTIAGPFDPGLYRVFDTSLGGAIVFTWFLEWVTPVWWGAAFNDPGDGTGTDDTTAWQAAIDAMQSRSKLLIPTRAFYSKTTAPLRIWTKKEVVFEMVGYGSFYPDTHSGIYYAGPDSSAAVQIYNTFGLTWRGIKIVVNNGTNTAQGGIDVDQYQDGAVIGGRTIVGNVTSDNLFERFGITSTNNSVSAYGIRFAYTSGQNVERQTCFKVGVNFNQNFNVPSNANRGMAFQIGGSSGPLGIGGSNAKNLRFILCDSSGAANFLNAAAGSVLVEDAETQFSTLDFVFASVIARISRVRSENQQQFLSGSGTITLITNEIQFGAWNAAIPNIHIVGTSKLVMIGNSYDDQASPPSNVDANSADNATFVGIGNHWTNGAQPTGLANFQSGSTDIGGIQGLGLYFGGGTSAPQGIPLRFGQPTQRTNLVFTNFGDGTFQWCNDAQPGCDDILGVGADGSGAGGGALVYKHGTKWASLASNLFKLLDLTKPGGGYAAPSPAAGNERLYYRDSISTSVVRDSSGNEHPIIPVSGSGIMSGTSLAVTFASALPNAPKNVRITWNANPGAFWWVTSINATGFTLNTAAASTAAFTYEAQ